MQVWNQQSDEGRVRSPSLLYTPCSSPESANQVAANSFPASRSVQSFLFPALSPSLPRNRQSLPTLLCSGLRFPEIAGYLQLHSAQTSASPRLLRMPWAIIRYMLYELSHRWILALGLAEHPEASGCLLRFHHRVVHPNAQHSILVVSQEVVWYTSVTRIVSYHEFWNTDYLVLRLL